MQDVTARVNDIYKMMAQLRVELNEIQVECDHKNFVHKDEYYVNECQKAHVCECTVCRRTWIYYS